MKRYETLTKKQLTGSFIACSPRQIPAPLFAIQSRILPRLTPEQQYFAENIESAFTLAKAQMGYTLYTDVPQIREPGLCYITVTDLPRLPFGVYYRYDNDHPALKQFLKLCAETAASTAAREV